MKGAHRTLKLLDAGAQRLQLLAEGRRALRHKELHPDPACTCGHSAEGHAERMYVAGMQKPRRMGCFDDECDCEQYEAAQ